MILGITGSRPNKIGGYVVPNPTYNYVMRELRRHMLEQKPDRILTGMALGTDQMAAEVAFELEIPFVAAVPFLGQEKMWPTDSKTKYLALLKLASEVVVVSEGGYSAFKMQVRNRWIVDNSDMMLAVWDSTPGGTSNCINYANSKGKPIIRIDPREAQ